MSYSHAVLQSKIERFSDEATEVAKVKSGEEFLKDLVSLADQKGLSVWLRRRRNQIILSLHLKDVSAALFTTKVTEIRDRKVVVLDETSEEVVPLEHEEARGMIEDLKTVLILPKASARGIRWGATPK